ncbi:MAG: YncE family protein [Spirochaetales bacterium]|nr:YncE family protein [Spirochaetales bacterium]
MIKKYFFIILLLFVLFLLPGCKYTYVIHVVPEDTRLIVNGVDVHTPCTWETEEKSILVQAGKEGYNPLTRIYTNDSFFSPASVNVALDKRMYEISFDLVEGKADYSLDGGQAAPLPFRGFLSFGEHLLSLKGEDGAGASFPVTIYQPGIFRFRFQEKPLFMHQIGVYSCGSAPKQVDFSPDDRYIYITLLGSSGFQIFDVKKREIIQKIYVGQWYSRCGFVEGLFIEKYRSYFVSQMTTARIFEYTINENDVPEYKRSISTEGVWSKVIAYSEPLDLLAVSNWCSNDVSLIEYASGKVVKKLTGIIVPRGLAFSHDGKYLYVASYEGGLILKYATDTWEEKGRFFKKYGAMRHIRVSPDDRKVFISNMLHREVYEIDAESFKLVHTYKASFNTNSIDITADAKLLFVSNRGPNNPENYTLRSPENGKIMVFDLERKELLTSFSGGNQPTGLDVSNDGNLLAFSNFNDNTIELYEISAMQDMLSLRQMNCLFPLNQFAFLSEKQPSFLAENR